MRIPFYRLGKIAIDGYLIDNISQPEDRILSVKIVESSGKPEIDPLPWERVLNLLYEGYKSVENGREENMLSKRLVMEGILYNPGIIYLQKK
ncbi:hypothetical protein HLB03_06275, partial [Acidianus sp. DSM 29099]